MTFDWHKCETLFIFMFLGCPCYQSYVSIWIIVQWHVSKLDIKLLNMIKFKNQKATDTSAHVSVTTSGY